MRAKIARYMVALAACASAVYLTIFFYPKDRIIVLRNKSSKLRSHGHMFRVASEANYTYIIPPQKTCALVGNSGILLNSGCGEEINSHDFVIRCNLPEIANFTRDVGNKTSMNIINFKLTVEMYMHAKNDSQSLHHLKNYQYMNGTIFWKVGSSKRKTFGWFREALCYLRSKFDLHFSFTYGSDAAVKALVKPLRLHGHPTTGIRAVVATLALCEEVTVYGFYPFLTAPNGDAVPYHYFGEDAKVQLGEFKTPHDFKEEYYLLRDLHKSGLLKFHTEKCN